MPAPRPALVRGPAVARRPLSIVLVLVGLFATGLGLGQATSLSLPGWPTRGVKAPPREFPVLSESRPVRISIPALRVRAPVERVGLAADGSIGVPPVDDSNLAAWYEQGPTPGEFGPAVIVGHVDTRSGPGVFHELVKLKPGARIEVTRRDRRVAVFEVNSVGRFAKAKLPTDRVFGDFSRPALRLITCGGRWRGNAYEDNIIVFASLVKTKRA